MAEAQRRETEFDQAVYRDGIASRWANWGIVIGGIAAAALTFGFRKNILAKADKWWNSSRNEFLDDAGKLIKDHEVFKEPETQAFMGATTIVSGFVGSIIGTVVGGVSGVIAGESKAKRIGNEIQESRIENEALRRENTLLREGSKSFVDREASRSAARESGEHHHKA